MVNLVVIRYDSDLGYVGDNDSSVKRRSIHYNSACKFVL